MPRPLKYSPEFRRDALERMKAGTNVTQLARDLGIRRKFLYLWKDQAEQLAADLKRSGKAARPAEPESPAEQKLRRKVESLELLVARQAQELDFFRGALQHIEERRRKREAISEVESTTKSGQ
ncbi:transposase [Paludibaculum fermentans]|uniref:Transposase n=1 Tax=Paludibaculum fermentans TaxID=1473598 RepID=A0A7S7NUF5_PALFE|nr:transposase [Paludibaculum fermentans]QOY90031.1 transposase [Paludibaculum fermentans]